MVKLNKTYIADAFKLPETTTIVFLNGSYRAEISDEDANSFFNHQILKIPQNTNHPKPLHLLFLTTQNCHNSLKIIAEQGSYTTIIEEYVSLGNDVYTSSSEINMNAKQNSSITLHQLQNGDITQANYQIKTTIEQEQNSKISTISISKGAKTAVATLHVKLLGKNASYSIKGVNLLRATQHIAHNILIEHFEPNCSSNVLFKGIITDAATSSFACRVVVHPGAIKTETHVTNKNLLLSELATVNTAPELEVYVDDVICTHGATVGQLDQDAIFYLRSRGIEKNEALKLLTAAFGQEVTDQFAQYDRLTITPELTYEP